MNIINNQNFKISDKNERNLDRRFQKENFINDYDECENKNINHRNQQNAKNNRNSDENYENNKVNTPNNATKNVDKNVKKNTQKNNKKNEIKKLPTAWDSKVWPEIKKKIFSTLESAQTGVMDRPRTFEFLGYDILIDEELVPWILEVRTFMRMSLLFSIFYCLVFGFFLHFFPRFYFSVHFFFLFWF